MIDLIKNKTKSISMKTQEQVKKSEPSIVKLSALEEDVLTILLRQKLYGLQLRQTLEKAYEGKRTIWEGSLYPTLHRMEKKGYVNSEWGEDKPEERCGARRKYYQITDFGEKVLKEREKVRNKLISL